MDSAFTLLLYEYIQDGHPFLPTPKYEVKPVFGKFRGILLGKTLGNEAPGGNWF